MTHIPPVAAIPAADTNVEDLMSWKTPKVAEVCVGMEINMYACAERK